MAFPCPYCSSTMITRNSRMESKVVRTSYVQCVNPHCGHVAKTFTEMVTTINPPAFPPEKILLPISRPADPRPPFSDQGQAQTELSL